jgi:hypothetical protein
MSQINWGERLKRLLPIFIAYLTQLISQNVGGIRLRIVIMLLNYGGRNIIESLGKALDDWDREIAQKKAIQEKDKIITPNSTVEEDGKAYEDVFNSGRKP